jgi:integrase
MSSSHRNQRSGCSGCPQIAPGGYHLSVWQVSGDGEYGAIVKLLMQTGQRRLEIGDLGWFEIDLEKRQIELPAERTKAARPHTIP